MIFQNPHPLKRTAIHARTELLLILAAIVNELVPESLLVTLVSILHVLQTELSTPSVHSETPRIILGRKIDLEIFTNSKRKILLRRNFIFPIYFNYERRVRRVSQFHLNDLNLKILEKRWAKEKLIELEENRCSGGRIPWKYYRNITKERPLHNAVIRIEVVTGTRSGRRRRKAEEAKNETASRASELELSFSSFINPT